MIDFACKQFRLDDIIKCSFGLTKADCRLFRLMLDNPDAWFTTDELAKKLGLNLSTVQRTVKRLHDAKVIIRSQSNLEGGGYVYAYRIKDKKQIREMIMQSIRRWADRVDDELQKW